VFSSEADLLCDRQFFSPQKNHYIYYNYFNTRKIMNVPTNLKYTKDHEWVLIEGDTATVGVTDFAQGELGDVVFVEIETEGETLEQGDTFGTIEAVKTVSDLFMPVGGEVVEVNEKLEDDPEVVNKDPYAGGWLIKIKVSDAAEADALMSADDYKALIG
jgi:glycine cleavage system H protein